MINLGDLSVNQTAYIPFNTNDGSGASVTITNLAAGDVHIHKDGGTTQRSSSAGITVSIDFDSITGNHLISIDTSDNTDAGFYASGSDYLVRIEGTTIDGNTVNAWVGTFSIQNRYMRGTDGANTTIPPTAVQNRQEMDSNSTQLATIKAKTDNLPSAIKKNTALANFPFTMNDSSTHVPGKSGLTITSQRSIDGGAFTATDNSAAEISNGGYKIDLSAADLNGDTVLLRFTATGADPKLVTIITEP